MMDAQRRQQYEQTLAPHAAIRKQPKRANGNNEEMSACNQQSADYLETTADDKLAVDCHVGTLVRCA